MRGGRRATCVAFVLTLGAACRSFAVENTGEPHATIDGGPKADAGSSVLQDGGGSPGHWCAQRDAAFCSDFDDDPFLADWPDQTLSGTGQVSPDSTSFRSPPRALSTTATPSGVASRARLCRSFAHTSEIHVAFDVRVDKLDPDSEVSFVSVRGSSASRAVYLDVVAHQGAWEMLWSADSDPDINHRSSLTAQPGEGTWARMKLDVMTTPDTKGTADHLVVHVDDEVVGDSTFTLPAIDSAIEVCLGVTFVENVSKAWQLHFDNVLVDTKPVE